MKKRIIFGIIVVVALAMASCLNKKAPVVEEQKADSTAVEVVDTTVVK